jgi:hypothetical protein
MFNSCCRYCAHPSQIMQMEPEFDAGQDRERPVHGLGHESGDVCAGRCDTGEQDFHSASARNGTFLLQIIAEGRAWCDPSRRLSSVVGPCVPMVALRPGLLRGAGAQSRSSPWGGQSRR